MDDPKCYELITCKNKKCQRKFGYIIRHLNQSPECKNTYSKDEYSNLEKESKAITKANDLARRRLKYDPEKRAKKYQREAQDKKRMERQKLAQREKYDPIARAERHKREHDLFKRNNTNTMLRSLDQL